MFFSQFCGLFSDLCQRLLHLAPSVPEGIVRVSVEGSLEGPHPVLQEHHEELLFNYRRALKEGT